MLPAKTKRALLILVILSLAGAALLGWWGLSTPLRHVIAVLPAGDTVYGIDQGEREYRFFQADASGKILAQFSRPVRTGESYRTYDCLTRDGDAVYVLERLADIQSDLIQAETVYRWDVGRGRLEAVWQLPVDDPSMDNNFAVQVRDGVLTFFQADYTGRQAAGRLMTLDETGTAAELLAFDYDIGVGFTDFYAAACGTVAFTTPAGAVWTVDSQGEAQQVFPRSDQVFPVALFGSDGGDRICLVGTDGTVYGLDLSAGGEMEELFDCQERGVPLEGLTGLALGEEGSFAAILSGGGQVGIFRDTGDAVLSRLLSPPARIVLRALLGFAAVWAAGAVIYALRRFFLFLTRGKVPIVTKLLAAFLPILVVSLVLMNAMVTAIFQKELVDGQYERLYLLTSQQTATLNDSYIEDVDPANPFENVYFYEIRAALNLLPGQGTLVDTAAQEEQQVYHATYFWLYKLVDGQLVSLVCEQDYVNVPVESRYSADVAEQFYRAAQTGECIRTGFTDSLGDWTVLLTPVTDESGSVVAVIETGDTRQSLDYAVEQGARRLALLNLGVLAVLAALLSAVIAISLHPLGLLRRKVEEIRDGKLGVQAPVHGHDEVSAITRAFNDMSTNVAFRDREIRMTSDGYSRFVPSRVFRLLEKSSVIDVRLEDQTSVEATVLNCSVGAFDQIARGLRSQEMFRLINQVLARLVPVVDGSGGLVDRFDRAGLLAIYTEQPDRALDAAVSLCQTLRAQQFAETGGRELDFHVTLSAGAAMIGIVGAAERLEAMTISEHTSFTRFLQPLAAEYGAAVLMTGSAAGLIPDFDRRYHARTIGFVRMKTLDRLERLYDVFDGDGETTRRLKEETREQFEKGVALFCSHQYYEARLLFIEVLKKHRRDRAAKNYLYLCDTYYRQSDGGEHPVWLETY